MGEIKQKIRTAIKEAADDEVIDSEIRQGAAATMTNILRSQKMDQSRQSSRNFSKMRLIRKLW